MRRLILVAGLVLAAFACSEPVGEMLTDAGQMMMPDAGAQPGDCPCEAGPQGEPGEQGPQGESGAAVLFCAQFGAFCGFSADTLDSMTECRGAVSQLEDDALICTARNIEAAKSGDNGGCAAIANLDPCGFTPAPVEPAKPTIAGATPLNFGTLGSDTPDVWGCSFDSTTFAIKNGQQFLLSGNGYLDVGIANDFGVALSRRVVGDSSNGTFIETSTFKSSDSSVTITALSDALPTGDYQVGLCVRCTGQGCTAPNIPVAVRDSFGTAVVLDLP
jgi:hypothetical protein